MTPNTAARAAGLDLFATTHWSVVLAAGGTSGQRSMEALQRLCESYWHPVYVFIRGKGFSPEDAEDLTQEYFSRLLKGEDLKNLDRSRGKFRAFLLATLKNFLANEWDRRKTQKRGGDRTILSLDQSSGETWFATASNESPEKLFERRWALTLLERVMQQLEADSARKNQKDLFQALKPALSGEGTRESYQSIGQKFGLSEGAVKVVVHRLRQKYRSLLQAEIGQTVASQSEIEEEIRYLFQIFQ